MSDKQQARGSAQRLQSCWNVELLTRVHPDGGDSMRVDQISRTDRLTEVVEDLRAERRRERALLRAPVVAPSGFPKKAVRRFAQEARDEFRLRG